MKRLLATLAVVLALTGSTPATAHLGEAPNTWYPSTCWGGGEVWHYTTGTFWPDYWNGHWWTERWTGAYFHTSDPTLQKHYLVFDGGECGPAQFVFGGQSIGVTGADGQLYNLIATKCAYYFRPQSNTNISHRYALDPQPAGCNLSPGAIVTQTIYL